MSEQTITIQSVNTGLRELLKVSDEDMVAFQRGENTKKAPLWRTGLGYLMLLMIPVCWLGFVMSLLPQEGMTIGEILSESEISIAIMSLIAMSAIALIVYVIRWLMSKMTATHMNPEDAFRPPFDDEKEAFVYEGALKTITVKDQGVTVIIRFGDYDFYLQGGLRDGLFFEGKTYRIYYSKFGNNGLILALELLG